MQAGAMRSTIRSWVIGILLAWIVVFAASFIVPIFIEPTGELYMRGLNRLSYWLWLQVAAFVLAVAAAALAYVRRADISGRLVWTSRVPLLVVAAELLVIGWTIRHTMFRL
jgi:hypothetical protein